MAKDGKTAAPIVIKRIKKGGHAHHGGAWKIAYADFVTAMMAFFLLMWLLGSTTEGDLKGIADFFQNPIRVSMTGGSGAGDATNLMRGGGTSLTHHVGQMDRSETPSIEKHNGKKEEQNKELHNLAEAQAAAADQRSLHEMKGQVEDMLKQDDGLAEFKEQVSVQETPAGLLIQLTDSQNRPMFDSGSAQLKPYTKVLLAGLGRVLDEMSHKVTVTGHTDATPFPGSEKSYSNWELSADRANAARRELVNGGGLAPAKIIRVVGVGDSLPLDFKNLKSPSNRRITLLVMNTDAVRALYASSGTVSVSGGGRATE